MTIGVWHKNDRNLKYWYIANMGMWDMSISQILRTNFLRIAKVYSMGKHKIKLRNLIHDHVCRHQNRCPPNQYQTK